MSLRIASLMFVVALGASELYARDKPDRLEVQTYPVADLVVPIPTPAVGVLSLGEPTVISEKKETLDPEFEPLIAEITSTIQPASWKNAGGPGVIARNPSTLSLVVRQTTVVHDEIAELVRRLRRERNLQVSLDVRHFEVTEKLVEKIGDDIPLDGSGQVVDETGAKSITEALQNDERSNLLSAQRITLFNDQTIWINNVAAGRTASLVLNPAVSFDRRSVKLCLAASGPREGAAAILSKTARVPDGQSLLVDCGPAADGAKHELFLITPRIIFVEEEEELLSLSPNTGTAGRHGTPE